MTQDKNQGIIIYTDGSARGNPGPGGYGILLFWGNHVRELSAGFRLTTNNRMELLAIIIALESLKRNDIPVSIYSDSQYVVKAVEEKWLDKWMATNFKGGKKNSDLWKRFYELSKKFKIKLNWVKGHANNPYNNRCDELATSAADGSKLLVDVGYEESKQ